MKPLLKGEILILSVLLFLLVGGTALADTSSPVGRAANTDGMVVLTYFVTESSTSVAVITRNGVQTESRIPLGWTQLADLVSSFRQDVNAPSSLGIWDYFQVLKDGKKLYDLLIAPIEDAIAGAKHLVIVPAGPLFYLPFGALYRCSSCERRDLLSGQFFIERYPISYAPSLCALGSTPQPRSGGEHRSILAIGNSLGHSLRSEREVKDIASLFPERTVLIGTAATEEAIKDLLRLKSYDVVHLAASCLLLDGQAPLLSGIRLSPGDGEDGILSIDELLGLGASIDLLTFSTGLMMQPPVANSTGTNEMAASAGETFRDLTDAILASGVASAVIPLGVIDDYSTAKLMEVMYNRMMQGATKDEALRQAKLSLLQDYDYRHPYFWAQFVLYGDWGRIGLRTVPPNTGKLDYPLYQKLQEWRTSGHAPGETPPLVSVVVILSRPAIQEDLETLRALSDKIEIQGAFGSFVQLRLPLTLLDAICALPEVRSVTTPAETISN